MNLFNSFKLFSTKTILILIGSLFLSLSANAQENCNNGLDDDGDGLIDCQDPDCSLFGNCQIFPACNTPYVFYMPPIYGEKALNCDIFGSDDIQIAALSSPATVKIYRGDKVTLIATLIVPVANPQSFTFPNTGAGSDQVLKGALNTILNDAGVYITSDQPIQVTYRLLSRPGCNTYNQDIMQLFGNDALGYAFYAGSQTDFNSSTYFGATEKHFVSVIATENNTIVRFDVPTTAQMEGSSTYSLNNVTDWSGIRTVTLNAGQSYIIATTNENPNGYTVSGVKITSNKPIVTNSGSHHTRQTQGGNADAGLMQLTPTKNLGSTYMVIDGGNPSNAKDYVVIVATKNNTQIQINGTVSPTDGRGNVFPATLNAGQYATFFFDDTRYKPYLITSNNARQFYVFHASSQTDNEFGLEQIPPIDECLGSNKVDFEKPNTNATCIIYVPTSGLNTLNFNNAPYTSKALLVNGNAANPIPNTAYSYVVIPNANINTSNNRVTCGKKIHVAYIAFTGGTGNYAFFSDYAKNVEIFDPITNQQVFAYTVPIPATPNTGVSHCISMGGCGANNTILSFTTTPGITATVNPATPKCFSYTLTNTAPCAQEKITAVVTNEFGFLTQVCLSINSSISTISLTAGSSTLFSTCQGTAVTMSVSASAGGGTINYAWLTPTGSVLTGSTISVANPQIQDAGNYQVTITAGTCVKIVNLVLAVKNCNDIDGDGIPNSSDPDDDNDGILDVVEGSGDADGDGISNDQDLDSDNDGIPDVIEAGGVDQNGDGIIDGTIATTGPNAGLATNLPAGGLGTLTQLDADSDGIPNFLDLDSDNDGIQDIIEAGIADANNDGRVDNFSDSGNGFHDPFDPAANGTPKFVTGADTNNDGKADSYPTNVNFDGDGRPNFLDLDSDNDGITDCTEAGGTDPDGNGLPGSGSVTVNANGQVTSGSVISLTPPNSDGTGGPNYLDLDSDNDGIPDIKEATGIGQPNLDTNNDGVIDNFADNDNDGLANQVDSNSGGTPLTVPNSDGTGGANYIDLDSDNDGIPDITEAGGTDTNKDGIADNTSDTDGDGLVNTYDTNNVGGTNGTALPVGDQDNDGRPNYVDLDSDGDGLQDILEAGGIDTNNDGRADNAADTDGDGLVNTYDPINIGGTNGTAIPNTNTDGNGRPNYLDIDADDDGITDAEECGANNHIDANNDGRPDAAATFTDTNNNGWSDQIDASINPTLSIIAGAFFDFDNDSKPNYIDLDSDADGIPDVLETRSPDADNNGIIGTGLSIIDADGDGLSNLTDPDFGPLSVFFNQDREGDGKRNQYDIDSDNDGITDLYEGQASSTYAPPLGIDSDNDGIDNRYDVNIPGAIICGYINTDGGSAPDWVDVDSDNDGTGPPNGGFPNNPLSDIREGYATNNDTDGDGFVGTQGAGGTGYNLLSGVIPDSDGDGLHDLVDLSAGLSPTNAVNAQTITTFPNTQNATTPERDWRDAPDFDKDGVVDALDLDKDNDGIPDTQESTADTDGDGLPDFLDLDSDNDGIPDCVEAGGTDPDGNGLPGTGSVGSGLTVNAQGQILVAGNPLILTPTDTDGDGKNDNVDRDSDNDGIPDTIEAFGLAADPDKDGVYGTGAITDTDADGLANGADSNNPIVGETPYGQLTAAQINMDGDGRPNYLDRDSDNDGITDTKEAGGIDANGDGILDGATTDADNDGLFDSVDPVGNASNPVSGTPLNIPNSDGTGRPNFLDLDSDGDGITDAVEAGTSDADNNGMAGTGSGVGITDADNDGIPDSVDPNQGGTPVTPTNTDGSGSPDYADIDSDNDGIPDVIEAQTTTGYVPPSGNDTDGDGIDNAYETVGTINTLGGAGTTPANTDTDTTPDYRDLDADNDGDSDLVEGNDFNNDGIPDVTPGTTDTDGDGLLDGFDTVNGNTNPGPGNTTNGDSPTSVFFPNVDGGTAQLDWRDPIDTDNDGIPNGIDVDDDNDGILDTAEGNGDTDGDGVVDRLDLDSDNDGIPDTVEAGNADPDGNGLPGSGIPTVNASGSPIVGGSPIAISNPADFDGDGKPNFQDLDSDNDGLNDLVESGGNLPDLNNDGVVDGPDTDGDGLMNACDPTPGGGNPAGTLSSNPVNTDGIGGPNYLDLDSDNDGIHDIDEAGLSQFDLNNDGVADGGDSDNDGIKDSVDGKNGFGDANSPNPPRDTDFDGIPDYRDLDSDNDGINDVIESGNAVGDVNNDGLVDGPDTDGDGINDPADTSTSYGDSNDNSNPDKDGDGVPNALDLDSDNDGTDDIVEAGLPDTNGDGLVDGYNPNSPTPDPDGDGIYGGADNNSNAFGDAGNTNPRDTDGDNVPDFLDLDSDNDGINDVVENGNGAFDTNNDGTINSNDTNGGDLDGDGIPNSTDGNNNLLGGFGDANNTNPRDTDGDGVPDYRDLDSDNDGINDLTESGIPSSVDTNSDGVVDGLDADGDGIKDVVDGSPSFGDGPVNGQPNTPKDFDNDGKPDYTDLDSDNDGINDLTESGNTGLVDVNSDGVVDGPDADGDGINDSADANDAAFGDPDVTDTPRDFDGDGKPDYNDLDSDNDGINDLTESGNTGLVDVNSDGVVDGPDSDGDGINDSADANDTAFGDPDANDTPRDFDGDGKPDYTDLDSDNDGINDLTESGNTGLTDTNSDGVVDGPDADGDGINDSADANDTAYGDPDTTDTPADFDGDGKPNYTDLDSDNDGINDLTESGNTGLTDINSDGVVDGPDSDGDGINDSADANNTAYGDPDTNDTPKDFDGDGKPNYTDLDSDNDGINDLTESGNTGLTDADSDGVVDGPDADGDGINDSADANNTAYGDPDINDTPKDTDGDGKSNYTDLDSDNDGINDLTESGNTGLTDTNSDGVVDGPDTDGDGINDSADANDTAYGDPDVNDTPKDTDKDGVPDYLDLDSDNDGINDVTETDPALDANGDGIVDGGDLDGDGINDPADNNDTAYGDPSTGDTPKDTDNDGVPDYLDLDSDNDGINDVLESGNGGLDANNDGLVDGGDADGDGIKDPVDGSPSFGDGTGGAGAPPRDTDGDGIADYLDLDSDNDGLPDVVETGNGGLDANNDGMIDGTDTDGDGIKDVVDGAPNVFGDSPIGNQPNPIDTDGDGVPNVLDTDSDNDGIQDGVEQGGLDANNDGILDSVGGNTFTYTEDCDGDGVPNYLDTDPCDLFVPEIFTPNGDGINDFLVIKGLDKYPNAQLKIFNRWGNLVYESNGVYKNDWNGTNQFGTRIGGDKLPVGTYFYILEPNDPKNKLKPKKGYVYLQY